MIPSSPALAQAYAHCETLTRDHDRDRWLAALFAPADARLHLYALTAFSYEVGRLRDFVREPLAGEMRLEWWREALTGAGRGEVAGHPVAAALIDTIERFSLPLQAFDNLLTARMFDLYDDPMPSLNDFEGYCGETCSVLFRLGALILGQGRDLGGADAAGHAGVAYAMVGLLRALPLTSARGQVYLPADILARHGVSREDMAARRDGPGLRAALAELRGHARRHLDAARGLTPQAPAEIAPAFLPLAVPPLYLARMERANYSPFGAVVEAPQWRRQWALWRAARGR
ncbi:phytoene/squalene synthase family protein [Methylocapsa sp. S129]|uniref:phytoene/squalene synthase family protein n=1 Tax=Methylocapsa sp. S129 TaxID=1641869 RepID=UPI00131B6186|nr:phytoene/squalene synthase family protein [Methylocapsa sp. S129]